jgi:hypothetical protein
MELTGQQDSGAGFVVAGAGIKIGTRRAAVENEVSTQALQR